MKDVLRQIMNRDMETKKFFLSGFLLSFPHLIILTTTSFYNLHRKKPRAQWSEVEVFNYRLSVVHVWTTRCNAKFPG